MKKIILLITASLMFLTAEDVKIKSAGTDADDGVVFKNSIDSTLVDIDGTGVVNIKGIPAAGATLRLFEAFGNGSNYLQLNPGVSLAENATWNLSSAGGSGNMFLGFESGSSVLSSGAANIGLGYNAAKALTSGVRNVALGYKALTAGTSANYNIAIGYQAGDVLTTGQKNIIIGTDADPSAASGENQVVIGYEAVGTADNQVVLGNSSTTQWVPGSADATDLGSTAKEFNNVYLGDGAVVNLGVDQDVSLTHIADTGVRMNGTSQLQFRDGNLKVSSSADGQLDMDADNELELVAPMVDINASTEVNISGEMKVGGKVSTGSEGAGVDVVFYSNTSGDDFTWDASEEKLVITGSNGQDALHIADGDLRVADKIYGDGSGLTGLTVSSITGDLTIAAEENNSGTLNLYADEGDDPNDKWRLQTANGGDMTIDSKQSESWSTLLTIGNTGNAALAGDLTVTGDDLTMATNTSGAALIGDGTNFNPVVISGDISVGTDGAAAIGSGVIVNADVSSSAAITDSKLATISTADKVGLAALDIDGGTDIGAAIVDADLFIIDDGAGGTNRKVTASRIKTYAQSGVSSAADDITTGDAAVTISTSSGAVNITPASGSAIVLDGTINVDAGVVTGATSVTSVTQVASTSLQTPLIEYTDGDDAITIADGGAVTTSGNLSVGGSNNELRFYEGSNYVGFEAPALSADKIWVLPTADGSSGQVLSTNGSGTLSWSSESGATSVNGLSDAMIEDNSMYIGNDPASTTNTAEYNLAVGTTALDAVTTGDKNVGVGYNALTALTTGSWNTAVGYEAGKAMTQGADNTAFGLSAGAAITTGSRNIAIGGVALDNVDTENDNLAIGYAALGGAIAGGEFNVGIGNYTLDALTTGDRNIALGYQAMTAITTGGYNIAIGYGALDVETSGWDNIAIGMDALGGGSMSGGYSNTAVGNYSLDAVTTGDYNSGFGLHSLTSLTSGSYNVGLGGYSGSVTTGSYNTSVGYSSGYVTTGSYNTMVGYSADPSGNSGSNQTVIGSGADGQADNSVTLGNDNVTAVYMAEDKGATVYASSVATGGGSAAGVYKSDGNYDVTLKTGNSTTGSITIEDGSNGDITIAPNGTGETDFDGNPIANFSASTVSITSATTLAASHNGKVLICNNSSDFSLTIPEDTLPLGFNCLVVQKGAGEITLAAASGNVTINNRNSHTKTANQWAIMTLICIDATTDANVFVSSGDGTS